VESLGLSISALAAHTANWVDPVTKNEALASLWVLTVLKRSHSAKAIAGKRRGALSTNEKIDETKVVNVWKGFPEV